MEYNFKTTIFICLSYSFIHIVYTEFESTAFQNLQIERDKKTTVGEFKAFIGISLMECARECKMREHCAYITYLKPVHLCYLLEETDATLQLEPKTDWLFSRISTWPKVSNIYLFI